MLSFHSSRNSDIENPLWENGFVRQLRPFKGTDNLKEAFHEIMKIIYILSPCFNGPKLETELIADFWSIVHLGKMWGYANIEVLTIEEQKQTEIYIDHISYALSGLLEGLDINIAFEMYCYDYPKEYNFIQKKE